MYLAAFAISSTSIQVLRVYRWDVRNPMLLILLLLEVAAGCNTHCYMSRRTSNIEWCSIQIWIEELSKQRNKKRRLHFFLYFYGLRCCRGIFCQFILHPIKYGTHSKIHIYDDKLEIIQLCRSIRVCRMCIHFTLFFIGSISHHSIIWEMAP